jgi:hypothetical protein
MKLRTHNVRRLYFEDYNIIDIFISFILNFIFSNFDFHYGYPHLYCLGNLNYPLF